ncbi:right-handed parallel beta-helix repeat-containing protein [bacterium]|nr:right-handed parallel beta-helix repeat-containing protein [bacterium]MDA7665475.1 right-handed parallel beta-helix repeat-containing protein [Verrucomicrobiota bacterium]
MEVQRCVVEQCAGFGLHLGSGSQRPRVSDCRAIKNDKDGFCFCWRVCGGVAEGNWLEGNGGYGMSIGHKDSDNLVRLNTVIGNAKGFVHWRSETEPMATHRITFEKNTVRDNEGWLFVDGMTHGTVIRNNTIEDTGAGRQRTGIRIGGKTEKILIEGNRIIAVERIQDER